MALLRVSAVDVLLARLAADPEEARWLERAFLIGVTRFFRDPRAFEALRGRVVGPLLDRDRSTVRVGVPSRSTGEDAGSVAMLFQEEMAAREDRRPLRVFGTDIDLPAFTHARHGSTSPAPWRVCLPSGTGPSSRPKGGQLRAAPRLREGCVFAPHDLARDPPFSRLDLGSCRDLMISLLAELQAGVIPRFHSSLREGNSCSWASPNAWPERTGCSASRTGRAASSGATTTPRPAPRRWTSVSGIPWPWATRSRRGPWRRTSRSRAGRRPTRCSGAGTPPRSRSRRPRARCSLLRRP